MCDEMNQGAEATDGPEMIESTEPIPEPELEGCQPLMQTLLKQFSEEFIVEVQPVIDPVSAIAESLAAASDDLAVGVLLPDLRDLLHDITVLTEKVAQQQAYVLIFGPLKSGKSTFMNAICSSYVSEVTSLPAYPCIVNVSHDTKTSCTVTRYDGSSETHDKQSDVVDDVIKPAHSELMSTIRRVEDDGEDFDPIIHMPHAIRKIDVHLPTGDLAESGAVLVDTPGLYSRMKFGYDRLTRDFRDAAACAIFIVKTDNLFLEQVFEEFHELLDLFSHVFLIVNLDTTKKDLDPSGELVPSLEHDDPGRIIDAFTDLAMSAPLKAAAEAGRLGIYPVDLLGSASARIRGADWAQGDQHAHGADRFDALLTDLTDYLNSSEYLRAFLNDSLRRAGSILGDLGDLTRHEAVSQLKKEADALQQQRQETLTRRQAALRLEAVDWEQQFQPLLDFLLTQGQQQAREIRRTTGQALRGAAKAWFETDRSLAHLCKEQIAPLLSTCRTQFLHFLQGEMTQQLPGMHAESIAVSPKILDDAAAIDIDLGDLSRTAMGKAVQAAGPPPVKSKLNADQIPVRRGLWDWLLFRSKTSVRKRMFGPSHAPSLPIAAVMKSKRIGQTGREVMESVTSEQFNALVNTASTGLPTELVGNFTAQFVGPMGETVSACNRRATEKLADLDARLAGVRRILAEFTTLGEHVDKTAAAVETLKDRFGFEDTTQVSGDGDADTETVGQEDEDFDGCYSPCTTDALGSTVNEPNDQHVETRQTADEEDDLSGAENLN